MAGLVTGFADPFYGRLLLPRVPPKKPYWNSLPKSGSAVIFLIYAVFPHWPMHQGKWSQAQSAGGRHAAAAESY